MYVVCVCGNTSVKMLVRLFFMHFVVICAIAEKNEDYKGYKVYNIELKTESQQDNFDKLRSDVVDYWNFPNLELKKTGRAMVPVSHQDWFEETLRDLEIPVVVGVEDVYEFLLKKEEEDDLEINLKNQYMLSRTATDRAFNLTRFLRYDEVFEYAQTLEEEFTTSPTISVEIVESGTTFQGRVLFYIKITSRTSVAENKPTVVLEAASIPREWITVSSAMYVVDMLLEDEQYSLLDEFDWIVIPVLNPDGYEFTHTNTRLWTKSRRTNLLPLVCPGVNVNRNFDIDFGNFDSSTNNYCSDIYAGQSAFSEPESQVVQKIVEECGDRIKLYISLQNKGGYITYPWNYERAASGLFREHLLLSLAISETVYGNYTVGVSSVVLQRASGTSSDYVRRNGVRYTFNLDIATPNVVVPVQDIPEIVEDVWTAVAYAASNIVY
ncbi:carboxypeptidase B-like [Plodia interpunctella]|uniref:carboxypeptidase B-like n=1 Tax=Plodia interpunctella TaxID=58824 RepID=UPI002368856E|nr:carboxypeptidase B-like [Plodia interpunctella]